MKLKKRMKRWLCAAIGCSLFLTGCENGNKPKAEEIQNAEEEEEQQDFGEGSAENGYATWVAYWDFDTAPEEMDACGNNITEITAFEALYTGEDDEVWLPEEMPELIALLKDKYQGKKEIYLSFVNDFRVADNTYSQKDVALLERLISTEESRKHHVKEMIDTVKKYALDGIELDYENLKRAEHLGDAYGAFVQLLYEEAQKEDLKVKVDVEYQTAQKANLPIGPEYVVMCYNLFGEGTSPGPKADREFLIKCCENYVNQGKVTMAFSTGGFDWKEGKECVAVTEREAVALFQEKCGENGILSRDEASGCVWFQYVEEGIVHEVWYADAMTLNYWKQIVKEQGYEKIAIWRMNGNEIQTLQKVMTE